MDDTGPDPQFRELSVELLTSISADEVGSAIVQHVELLAAEGEEEDRAAVIQGLPAGTLAIYTTYLVDFEVNNGGFNQFFWNPSGEFAGSALAGYELLGAEEYAAVMRAAIATHETERDLLAPFYENDTLEAFSQSYKHTALNEVDQRYYGLGDRIYDVWAAFVRRRPELFAS
jgi:hypothetical protein